MSVDKSDSLSVILMSSLLLLETIPPLNVRISEGFSNKLCNVISLTLKVEVFTNSEKDSEIIPLSRLILTNEVRIGPVISSTYKLTNIARSAVISCIRIPTISRAREEGKEIKHAFLAIQIPYLFK